MPFTIGENVGPYRIVEKLGQGGMATVFKAYHPALDRYVAIKVLHPALQEDPNFLARFQREARIVAKLDHPNIVPVYDFAEHRGLPYLVMRFIEGETLKARLQREPLSLEEIEQVVEAVGAALAYAHRQGVLHRDIKPSNIILTPQGQIYLTDFGLARMAEAGESTLSRDLLVGTPQYISPEQAKGETRLDARTDIYSFGVVLYELLVGRPPFQADTPYAVIHDHIFTPLPLPRSVKPELPEPLERVLLKALAKNPDDRFQSVEEMVAAFQAAVKQEPAPTPTETVAVPPPAVEPPPPVAPPPTPSPPPQVEEVPAEEEPPPKKARRRWPWVVAGVSLFLCLLVLGLGAIARQRRASLPTDGEEAQQLLEQARAAVEENPERAVFLYEQAQEADPQLVEAYLELGDLLLQQEEPGRALAAYLEGVEANPENVQLRQEAAGLALLADRPDIARPHVEWLLAEQPDDATANAYAGLLVLAEGGTCGEARPRLEEALQLDEANAWAHYAMGVCLLQEGNPAAAQAEFDSVLAQEDAPPLLKAAAGRRSGGAPARGEALIEDFEGGAPGWDSEADDQGSSLICEPDDEVSHDGAYALRIEYNIVQAGYGVCGTSFEKQDWSGGEGIGMWIRSSQPGQMFGVGLAIGGPEATTPFEAHFEAPPASVEEWTPIFLPWEVFARAPWAESGGPEAVDPRMVVGLWFEFTAPEAPREGVLWVDDIRLQAGPPPSGEKPPPDERVVQELSDLLSLVSQVEDARLREELTDAVDSIQRAWEGEDVSTAIQLAQELEGESQAYRQELGSEFILEMSGHLDKLLLLMDVSPPDFIALKGAILSDLASEFSSADAEEEFRRMLAEARDLMQAGRRDEAVSHLKEIQDWVVEHEAEIGQPQVDEVLHHLEITIQIVGRPSEP